MPPAAIAVPVATFLGGSAVAGIIGAAVAGAVYGAVIGAATSLISGKNVLKGALTGAAIGGVTSGALQGFGVIDYIGKAGTSIAKTGAEAGAGASVESATAGVGIDPANAAGAMRTGPRVASGVGDVARSVAPAAKEGMSDATKNIIGQVVSGGGKALGKVMEAKSDAKLQKDLAKQTRKAEIDRVERNVPGIMPTGGPKVVSLPQRWQALSDVGASIQKYKQPIVQAQTSEGLLTPSQVDPNQKKVA